MITAYFANYTSWSDKAKKYVFENLNDRQIHFGAEHHLVSQNVMSAFKLWGKKHYRATIRPAAPSQKSATGTQGGTWVAIHKSLVSSTIGVADQDPRFSSKECDRAWTARILRNRGRDVLMVAVYIFLDCAWKVKLL